MLVSFLSLAAIPGWPEAPEWLSMRVLACGLAAVALVILSLLLRGLAKLALFLVVLAIGLGGYWFVEERWGGGGSVLPPELAAELDAMAGRALKSPEARSAWEAMEAEWAKLEGAARTRMEGGGDAARAVVAKRLETKAAELRKEGKKAAAEELMRLRAKVAPEE